MCIQNALQSKIAELTQNGETIAHFLADTLQGKDYAVKVCHQLDAAKLLTKYGFPAANHDNITPIHPVGATLVVAHPNDDSTHLADNPTNSESLEPPTDNSELKTENHPTLRDIVAYPVARYIRDRTNDGETLVDALCEVMHDTGKYYEQGAEGSRHNKPRRLPARPCHRLAAAKELLRRAFGETVRRRNSAAHDPIADIDHSDPINGNLARLVRDNTEDGTEAAELMIRIAENDEEEAYLTPANRVSAAKELLHRAYDLNYEAVTWEHVQAYKRATDVADEGELLARTRIQSDRIALIREYNEAYKAGDEEAMRAAEDKFYAYNRYIRDGIDPDEAMKYADYGPEGPDPADEQDERDGITPEYTHIVESIHDLPDFDADAVAATVSIPKLTIPLNNRSP